MTWQPGDPERREDYIKMSTEMAVIKQQLTDMVERRERMHEENQRQFQRINRSLDGNGSEGLVTRSGIQQHQIQVISKELVDHSKLDLWLFGTMITLLLFIAGKVFILH